MRLCLPLAALCWLLLCTASLAGEPAITATLRLDAAFPLDLPTVMAAQLDCESESPAFQLSDQRLGPGTIIAQQEAGTERLWFVGRVADKQLVGSTARIPISEHSADARVTISARDGGFQFSDGSREVLFYQQRPLSWEGQFTRAGFVHPLRSLDDEVLTEVFPADHRHHHGVFWAWHQLWVGDRQAGDPWVTTDFLVEVREARIVEQGPVFATLRVVADWTSPRVVDEQGRAKAIIEETTRIRLFRAGGDAQCVDFYIQLKPLLSDVRLGGADNERGYSGFTVRLRPPGEMRIRDAQGVLDEDGIGRSSGWADVSGLFRHGGLVSGVAILSHSSLPEFPPRWLLRHYGMQSVVYPGREPIRLSAEQPLVLRHALLIHRGDAAAARVADQQQAYQGLP